MKKNVSNSYFSAAVARPEAHPFTPRHTPRPRDARRAALAHPTMQTAALGHWAGPRGRLIHVDSALRASAHNVPCARPARPSRPHTPAWASPVPLRTKNVADESRVRFGAQYAAPLPKRARARTQTDDASFVPHTFYFLHARRALAPHVVMPAPHNINARDDLRRVKRLTPNHKKDDRWEKSV